jgi:hypothetical protein
VLCAAWRAARDDARSAYQAWSNGAGQDGYAAYRAAVDREEAAAAAFADQVRHWRTRLRRFRPTVRRNQKLGHRGS